MNISLIVLHFKTCIENKTKQVSLDSVDNMQELRQMSGIALCYM